MSIRSSSAMNFIIVHQSAAPKHGLCVSEHKLVSAGKQINTNQNTTMLNVKSG